MIDHFSQSINPILIWVYPRKWGWLDLPHSDSNLSNSHSPSRLIQSNLLLLTNNLALLPLCLPRLLWSSSLPLAIPFKLQCFSQNMPIIPSQHMPVPSHIHSPLPSEPLFSSIPTSPLVLCPLFHHQFCTTQCSHHCSLGPSQNCHFIFPQTPCPTPM